MGDGGLFEHGGGLGALPGGAQRLAIGQRGVGILGIGAVALAVDFHRAPRIGIGAGAGSAFDVIEPVISDMVWQPPSPAAKIAVTAADARSRARLELLTHGTLTHGYQANGSSRMRPAIDC